MTMPLLPIASFQPEGSLSWIKKKPSLNSFGVLTVPGTKNIGIKIKLFLYLEVTRGLLFEKFPERYYKILRTSLKFYSTDREGIPPQGKFERQ